MRHWKRTRAWALSSIAVALSVGCAGRAANDGPPGSAGSGNAGAGQAGQANDLCRATLEEANALGGPPCPTALCAANVWAADCTALPVAVTRTYAGWCGEAQTITLEQSGERSKVCYYEFQLGIESQLTAVEAWDASRSECGGHIVSDGVPTSCAPSAAPMPLCDRASPAAPKPPNDCFDRFSGSCGPCCPATQPDCTKEPDGYPGYACVARENSFCSCTCQQGMWSCGC